MDRFGPARVELDGYLERVLLLNARYRAGEIHAHVPAELEQEEPLDDLVRRFLPASATAFAAAARSLFFSLPVAFDPEHSVGPYLAAVDRDPHGEPYRFIDMGALIATQGLGENDPGVVEAVLRGLPFVASRYAHSEYQTTLSLRLKARLDAIAPAGTPRHFVVNTGAEAVENAIKAVLLNRVRAAGEPSGGVIVSFEGAFHGRTLGSLAATHRKKARLGFPTFDWPHVSFPALDGSARESARREERSLKQLWDLLVSSLVPEAERRRESFRRELETIDEFLRQPGEDAGAFVAARRAAQPPEVLQRSRRVAAVLVEPIQGEGGVRMTSPAFMQRLRLLTRVFDVPLIFDEVQTGWGATGRLWAHERFELPLPPDAVVWAKKAQNGVLFVSEELATFFQEEKKFNTTWEGDSAGMVRLLATLDRLDLDQVERTGRHAREGLEALARDFSGLIRGVRGAGVMLGFDVSRADWRDGLRDLAFRLGLVLLPAGERTLRFYPRYDTEPYAIDEALAILRRALEDLLRGRLEPQAVAGPEIRVGTLECPVAAIEVLDIGPGDEALWPGIMAVEVERYGGASNYPPDILLAGRRPLLQFPLEMLQGTLSNPGALGVVLRDRVSGRIVAYAIGSALEDHDEEGVSSDPRLGERDTFYLQAMATLPSVRNQLEIEGLLLDQLRARALASGYRYLSTLIEERFRGTGPDWFRDAQLIQTIPNYLRGGSSFVYLHASLNGPPATEPAPDEADRRRTSP
jgi:4-aminobutyrate aminotransferase/(S)-3-amino-2-methylpropionate transaminase